MALLVSLMLGLKYGVERLARLVGPLFVTLAVLLIGTAVTVHFVHNIPFYAPYASLQGVVHVAASLYIAACIAYNYGAAIVTAPGSPPALDAMPLSDEEKRRLRYYAEHPEHVPRGQYFSWCRKCDTVKPPRTHHCHVCQRCVFKMDHHCPWVANCVGHQNHHYFYLFLLYLWLGCAYASLLGFLPFAAAANYASPFAGVVPRGAVIFSFITATAVFVAMVIMLGWQSLAVFTNQTTIEFYQNKAREREAAAQGRTWQNPYDLGYGRNFQLFFGTAHASHWYAWLLPGGAQPTGDGMSWSTRHDHDSHV